MSKILKKDLADALGVTKAIFDEVPESAESEFVLSMRENSGRMANHGTNSPASSAQAPGSSSGAAAMSDFQPDVSSQELVDQMMNPGATSDGAIAGDSVPSSAGAGEIAELVALLERERHEQEEKIQQAYERGVADGERHRAEFEAQLSESYHYGLKRLEMLGNSLEVLARSEALEIAILVARRILQKEIEMNPLQIIEQVKRVSSEAMGKKELTIRLNPQDLAAVRAIDPELGTHFPAVGQVSILEDHDLQPGDCLVDTEVEQINLSLDEQLAVLKKALEEELA